MKRLIYIVLFSFNAIAFAQVGIGTDSPKSAVHIATEMKLKDVKTVTGSMTNYPRHLIADNQGNLAVFTGLPTTILFKDVITTKMPKLVVIPNSNTDETADYAEESLGVGTKIKIPPRKVYALEITYSISAMGLYMGSHKGEFGVFIKKRSQGGELETIKKSERFYSVNNRYATGVSAKGRAITYSYVDIVTNDTDDEIEVEYDLYGCTQYINLRNYAVSFGSYNDGTPNYNWGRGLMVVAISEIIKDTI